MTERRKPNLVKVEKVEPASPELLDETAEAFKSAISSFNADEVRKLTYALRDGKEIIAARAVLLGLAHNQDEITPPDSKLGQ